MSECVIATLTSMEVVEAKSVLPKDWKADLNPRTLDLTLAVTELIRRTTSRMPQDIIEALVASRNAEADGSRAANTLDTMLENITLADDHVAPLCQDTGTVIFWVRHPYGVSQQRVKAQIRAAVRECTAKSWLRPNCVEALSGKNPGNNMDPFGEGHPVIHFEEWDRPGARGRHHAQGRRLRERGRPVLAAGRGDRRGPRPRRGAQVHPRRGAPGPGQGLRPGHPRRVHRRRPRDLLRKEQGTILRKLGTANPDPKLDAFEQEILKTSTHSASAPWASAARPPSWACRERDVPPSRQFLREHQLHVLGVAAQPADPGRGWTALAPAERPRRPSH